MSNDVSPIPSFRDLALIEPVLKALNDVGYEPPSPIQAQVIPFMLQGQSDNILRYGTNLVGELPSGNDIDIYKEDKDVIFFLS